MEPFQMFVFHPGHYKPNEIFEDRNKKYKILISDKDGVTYASYSGYKYRFYDEDKAGIWFSNPKDYIGICDITIPEPHLQDENSNVAIFDESQPDIQIDPFTSIGDKYSTNTDINRHRYYKINIRSIRQIIMYLEDFDATSVTGRYMFGDLVYHIRFEVKNPMIYVTDDRSKLNCDYPIDWVKMIEI